MTYRIIKLQKYDCLRWRYYRYLRRKTIAPQLYMWGSLKSLHKQPNNNQPAH